MKNNLKIIIAIIITAIVCISGTIYAESKITADKVTYSGNVTVKDKIDDLYKNSTNLVSEEVKEILSLVDTKIEMKDVISQDFMSKVSTSKAATKKVLDNSTFRSKVNTSLLSWLSIALVPALSNNTNVIYSSEYSSEWPAYRAYSSAGNSWSTASGATANAYIGYNFNKNVDVRIAKFYNGGYNNGYSHTAKQVKLQYSDDNINWLDASDIYTLENIKKDVFIYNTKTDKSSQYWRIYIITPHDSSYIEIGDLQFYGV